MMLRCEGENGTEQKQGGNEKKYQKWRCLFNLTRGRRLGWLWLPISPGTRWSKCYCNVPELNRFRHGHNARFHDCCSAAVKTTLHASVVVSHLHTCEVQHIRPLKCTVHTHVAYTLQTSMHQLKDARNICGHPQLIGH